MYSGRSSVSLALASKHASMRVCKALAIARPHGRSTVLILHCCASWCHFKAHWLVIERSCCNVAEDMLMQAALCTTVFGGRLPCSVLIFLR
jgi:hypothetical protein